MFMKKAILIATMSVMTLGLNAGDWGKAPVGKAPIEECVDLGGEISVGYMTVYVFRGFVFATDSVWMDVNYTFEGLAIPITIGAWYLNGIHDPVDYDELDLYISLALGTFAGFDVELGYLYYLAPEGNFDEYGEIYLSLSRSLGFIDLTANTSYTSSLNAWFHEVGIEKTFGLTDNIDLVLGAGVGYSDNYNSGGADWNHYYLSASLPIQLNCRTTFTPYIGWNGGPEGWVLDGDREADDILHGGATLTVTF